MTLAGDFTLEAWIKPTSKDAYQFILGSSAANGALMWALNMGATGNMAVGVSGVGWPLTFAGVSLVNGQVHHVAVSRLAGVARAFVDGVQVGASVNNATQFVLPPAWVGGQSGGASFDGQIDSVRVSTVGRYAAAFTPAVFVPFGA